MKKKFRNFTFALRASLLISVISVPALANADREDGSQNLSQKIHVRKGVLIPFKHHPDVAKGLFVIENKSSHDLLLQNVSAPVCDHVSANHSDDLQLSYQTGGDNIFRHLAIPHNSVMVFPKEGYHLICYGLKHTTPGQDKFPFTFYFRDHIKVTTDFALKTQGDDNTP